MTGQCGSFSQSFIVGMFKSHYEPIVGGAGRRESPDEGDVSLELS